MPFRGKYYEPKPERRQLLRNLIYPMPDRQFPFLEVYLTRMTDDRVHAGPNAVLSLKREGCHRTSSDLRDFIETMTYAGFWRLAAKHARSKIEEMHRSFRKEALVRSSQKLIPKIREEDVVPGETTVPAQALDSTGSLIDNFLIINGSSATDVCDTPSPGRHRLS